MRRLITSLLAAAMLSTLAAGATVARNEHVTYGDVRANFLNADGGGGVIRAKKLPAIEDILYIPPAYGLDSSIRPLPIFNNNRYCTTDWQVVTIITWLGNGDFGFTSKEAKQDLLGTSVTFSIPGVDTNDVEATAVRRAPNPAKLISLETGLLAEPPVWSRAWGVFYAPGELPVGSHTLSAIFTFPGGGQFPLGPITFHVDPAGSGTCS